MESTPCPSRFLTTGPPGKFSKFLMYHFNGSQEHPTPHWAIPSGFVSPAYSGTLILASSLGLTPLNTLWTIFCPSGVPVRSVVWPDLWLRVYFVIVNEYLVTGNSFWPQTDCSDSLLQSHWQMTRKETEGWTAKLRRSLPGSAEKAIWGQPDALWVGVTSMIQSGASRDACVTSLSCL